MIHLNFIPFKNQNLGIRVYRRPAALDRVEKSFHIENMKTREGKYASFEISFVPYESFEAFDILPYTHVNLIAKSLYNKFLRTFSEDQYINKRKDDLYNKRLHYKLEKHSKGIKTVWFEPYFLKSHGKWGVLFDFSFVVDTDDLGNEKFKLDRDILIASGSLNEKGNSNVDFYVYKHRYLKKFIKEAVPTIASALHDDLDQELYQLPSKNLSGKVYQFGNGYTSNSPYVGLLKNPPLAKVFEGALYYFLYLKDDRDIAVTLLKGLRGETNPSTFPGIAKLFRTIFSNDVVKGAPVPNFSDDILELQIEKIKSLGSNVVPIIITNSRKTEEDELLYFRLKHMFTNAGIACQVVTKDLVSNEFAIKYSLSNIALQIFSKAGGKPWKMKPATKEYLIIGIGQSYNLEQGEDGNKVEKNLTYSVLTDSSGLFKDIQVLGEGLENQDDYHSQLVANLTRLITASGYKKVTIHVPFRMSKDKVLEKVSEAINGDIELNVLVINGKNDFFGFDYSNNGLVPFESTYIKTAKDEYLVWFEGLQYNNPKITKRFGNPLLIKFWYSNKPEQFHTEGYKETLLQDCINLSGANWRGFKAKQLPVSVFYCQRIAEFISEFKKHGLAHIEISNLKPWFL